MARGQVGLSSRFESISATGWLRSLELETPPQSVPEPQAPFCQERLFKVLSSGSWVSDEWRSTRSTHDRQVTAGQCI